VSPYIRCNAPNAFHLPRYHPVTGSEPTRQRQRGRPRKDGLTAHGRMQNTSYCVPTLERLAPKRIDTPVPPATIHIANISHRRMYTVGGLGSTIARAVHETNATETAPNNKRSLLSVALNPIRMKIPDENKSPQMWITSCTEDAGRLIDFADITASKTQAASTRNATRLSEKNLRSGIMILTPLASCKRRRTCLPLQRPKQWQYRCIAILVPVKRNLRLASPAGHLHAPPRLHPSCPRLQ